mgnify:CR=1 FL=1
MRKKAFAEGMATSTEVVDAETLLSKTKVARLAAYYEYDVTLMNRWHCAEYRNSSEA